ncbi:MAG TPA: tyrosine-type recombinase/integrase [Ktedonobacteraceae bacterium]|nr:tyrosine-type recombinase/integrase [Ktedonobacteraceae bacterium]
MARRGNGEGSVYRRKSDGRWVASLSLPDGTRKVFYGKKQSEVIAKLDAAANDLRRGMLTIGSHTTVQEYLENWLEKVHKPTIRLSTYLNYSKLVKNYLVPGLGKIKLQKLTPQQVQSFYSQKLSDGLTAKTVNNIHGVLHVALDNAVKWNILPRNVCDAVTPPRIPRKEQHVLTKQQAHTLLEEVKAHRLEALLTLAITTGMREGELLALHWQDINFEDRTLQVKRAVSYLKGYGYIESEPKTAKGRRMISLPAFVVEVLQRHRIQQQEQRREIGDAWIDKDLVFTNAQGYFYSSSTLRKVFRRFLVSIGLPHIRFHNLRHSAATILLAMGVHPKVVQEILGHSQITMTLDVYSHALPTMQEDVTKRWDSEFGKTEKKRKR